MSNTKSDKIEKIKKHLANLKNKLEHHTREKKEVKEKGI